MAILIKGMEMPKTCIDCPFSDHEAWCLIPGSWRERYYCPKDEISEHCPLIEVPEPHGRLINADALLMRINHEVMEAYMDGACYGVHPSQEYLYLLGEIIDDAPTVILASEEG